MSTGFPTPQGSFATSNGTTTGTAFTVNLPASIVAGELLVCWIARRASAGTGHQTFTFPAGWSVYGPSSREGPNGAKRYTFEIWTKIATGSEGASITVSSSLASSQIYCALTRRFSDWLNAGSPDFSTGSWVSGASGNYDPPVNNPAPGFWNYLIMPVVVEESTVNAIGYPTGYGVYNQVVEGVAASATGLRIAICAKQLTGTTDNPGTGSSTSVSWDSNTFALRGSLSGKSRSQAVMFW